MFDLLALIALSIGAFFFLPQSDSPYLEMARWFITISGFIVFVVFWIILLQPSLATICIRFVPGRKIREWVEAAFDRLQSGMKQGLHPWQIFLTVIVWLGSWSAFWVFLQFDGGVALGLNAALVVFLVGTLGLTVTVTPGGIGTFEAAVAAVLVSYGYSWDHALLSAVGLRVAALLPNAVLAIYTIFVEGFDLLRVPQNVAKSRS